MADVACCPDRQTLQRFSLGWLSASEIESVERHLNACASCLAVLEQLAPTDALVDAVRQQAVTPAPLETLAARELMERLQRQPPSAANPTVDLSAAPTPSIANALSATEFHPELGRYDFLAPAESSDEIGRLGPYRILEVLGSGGMGIVFRAENVKLGRTVALKVMLPAMAAAPSARERFLREARTAASIEHEHVVTIYQVGEDRGVPYLAMQLLRGQSLDDRLRRDGLLSIAEVLRIGRETALGLAAAHERGLVHRDVKPANLWLAGEHGRVKILDFGLARAARDTTHLTQTGLIIGTPAYMAPEQARRGGVDHRADLFSLGCVLYRCCTGRLPFEGSDTLSILAALALDEPAPPRQIAGVPARLSSLILRLLAKDPAMRPPSAHAVIEQLTAMEAGTLDVGAADPDPTEALDGVPAAVPSRRRWRPFLVAATLLIAMLGPLAWWLAPAKKQLAEEDAEVRRFSAGGGTKSDPGQWDDVYGVALAPDGRLFSGGQGGVLRQWDLATGEERGHWQMGDRLTHVSLTPDHRFVLCGVANQERVSFVLFDPSNGKVVRRFPGSETWPTDAIFSPDGRQLITTGQGCRLVVWDVATGARLRRITTPLWVTRMSASADFRWALSCSQWRTTALLWHIDTGEEGPALVGHRDGIVAVALSADGRRALTGSKDKTVRLWDVATGNELQRFEGHTDTVASVAFSSHGRWALSGGADHTLRLWDVASGQEVRCFKGHTDKVTTALFTRDGLQAISGSADQSIRLWRLPDEARPSESPGGLLP